MAGRIENLKPWGKGVSGNPGGRPKKLKLDEILVELLEKDEGADALAIGEALVKKAKRGDLKACQLIAERTQGKVLRLMQKHPSPSRSVCVLQRLDSKPTQTMREAVGQVFHKCLAHEHCQPA